MSNRKYSTIMVSWMQKNGTTTVITLHDKTVKEAIVIANNFGYVELPMPKWYQFWKQVPEGLSIKTEIRD